MGRRQTEVLHLPGAAGAGLVHKTQIRNSRGLKISLLMPQHFIVRSIGVESRCPLRQATRAHASSLHLRESGIDNYHQAAFTQMTGLEFKIYLVGFLVLTVPFSIGIGIQRSTKISENTTGSFLEDLVIFVVGAFAAYLVLLILNWDDKLEVRYLFGYTLGITLFVVIHTAVILAGAKLMELLTPPLARGFSFEQYFYTFFCVGLLWNDLSKGQEGVLFKLIQSFA